MISLPQWLESRKEATAEGMQNSFGCFCACKQQSQASLIPNNNFADARSFGPFTFRSFRHGCYYVQLDNFNGSTEQIHGTMRIEKTDQHTKGSGDLYFKLPNNNVINPSAGIPTFANNLYSYYLQLTDIIQGETIWKHTTIRFTLLQYNAEINAWTNLHNLSAKMEWKTAPIGYLSPDNYLEGEVKDINGQRFGTLKMGWLSSYLRKAKIEIDSVSANDLPLNNGEGVDWQNIFEKVGWQVSVQVSDTNVTKPDANGWWELHELHEKMLSWRNNDNNWHYHILCVNRIIGSMFTRGVMYDSDAVDTNKIPREGAAISTDWQFENNSQQWGSAAGQRFADNAKAFFRTAVHELGHAMGLHHNDGTNTIMNTTDSIMSPAFPNNMVWNFTEENENRLKHYPDINVRPGNSPQIENHFHIADAILNEAKSIDFKIEGTQTLFPFGAPIRIELAIENIGEEDLLIPDSLSLKADFISGYTEDTAGVRRKFKTLIHCADSMPLRKFKAGEKDHHSFTLLRGDKGALFPSFGIYTVFIEMRWEVDGKHNYCNNTCQIVVNAPENESHAKAALQVMDSSDLLLAFVIGGEHLKQGNEAIKEVMDCAALKDHFAYLEFRRKLNDKSLRIKNSALNELNTKTVLSKRERVKLKEKLKEIEQSIKGSKNNKSNSKAIKNDKKGIVRSSTNKSQLLKNITAFKKRCNSII